MRSLYALVDVNAMYCSCEALFRPDLAGRPIIVLSNNDGSIIARNDLAKALGLKMGQPFFEAKQIIAQHQVVHFSSNYTLYGDMAARFIHTLSQFSPDVEVYSIDEAFLDLGDFVGVDVPTYARSIKQTVRKWVGLPVCVGVAPTKTLAKLANRLAKKSAKANGVVVLTDPRHLEAALKQTEVGDVWGIGSRYAEKLRSFGIHSAWDLSRVTDAFAKKHLTVVGLRLVKELRGEPCADLEINPPAKKGICTSRSFGKSVSAYSELSEAVATYAARCALKLRKQQSNCSVLTVFIYTNRFREKEAQYYGSKTIQLPVPTSSTLELVQFALLALQAIYKEGYNYKKAGVYITGISSAASEQMLLFDVVDREKHYKLMHVLDALNSRMGTGKVKLAAEGIRHAWQPRAENVSPCYTTRISDVLKVH